MAAMTHDDSRRTAAGLGLAVLSAGSFGLSGPLARGLLDAGWSAGAAVTARVLLAAVVLAPLALVSLRGRWALLARSLPLLVGYGLSAVALAQLAYFNAVAHLPVGVALLIEYVAPVAVVLWMWLRHHQTPGPLTLVGGGLAAVGLVLVLDLFSASGSVSLVGVGWGLLAMAGAATYFVLSSHDHGGLPGTVLAAGGLLVAGVVLLLAGVVGIVPMHATTRAARFDGFTTPWWVPVLLLGVVTAAVAYVAGIAATRRLGSRLASFVALGEVLAALVFAWLLLGELPRTVQILGGVVVLAGVVVVKLGEDRRAGAGAVDEPPLTVGVPVP